MAAVGVTLIDDPTIAESFGAASHDAEGLPTRRLELIGAGVLAGFLHNTYTAPRGDSRAPRRRCAAASSRLPESVPARCTCARDTVP